MRFWMEHNTSPKGNTINVAIMFHFPQKTPPGTFKRVCFKDRFKANMHLKVKPFHTGGYLLDKHPLNSPRPRAHTVRHPPPPHPKKNTTRTRCYQRQPMMLLSSFSAGRPTIGCTSSTVLVYQVTRRSPTTRTA